MCKCQVGTHMLSMCQPGYVGLHFWDNFLVCFLTRMGHKRDFVFGSENKGEAELLSIHILVKMHMFQLYHCATGSEPTSILLSSGSLRNFLYICQVNIFSSVRKGLLTTGYLHRQDQRLQNQYSFVLWISVGSCSSLSYINFPFPHFSLDLHWKTNTNKRNFQRLLNQNA